MDHTMTAQLVGTDGPDASYWYWVWPARSRPAIHVVGAQARDDALASLVAALPSTPAGSSHGAGTGWGAHRGRPDLDGMIRRCLEGPFARVATEERLSWTLAEALLPAGLAAALLAAHRDGIRVQLRIQPAPSCAVVPWELLPVGEGVRLIDVADVVTVPPPLNRENASLGASDEPRAGTTGQGALRIIDPAGDQIFPDATAFAGSPAGQPGTVVRGQGRFDRVILSQLLTSTPSPSRLLYVGHVVQPRPDAKTAALLLGCGRDVYGVAAPYGGQVPFTAEDLARGTLGYHEGIAARQQAALQLGGQQYLPRVPAAAQAGGEVLEVPGSVLWPMPPRVALVACDSGLDLAQLEPYGLVTAVLEAGAELVTATRWTLLSDTAFARSGHAGTPLLDAARAIDTIQDADDPIHALGQWQRDQLTHWRATGELRYSPLTWASLSTYDARRRWVNGSTGPASPDRSRTREPA